MPIQRHPYSHINTQGGKPMEPLERHRLRTCLD
jgi:hypothetical protein